MARDVVDGQLADVRCALDTLGTVRLGPVLSSREVSGFEQQHGIELPDGFRRFVLEIGNGGDGPGYGLRAFDPHSQQPRIAQPFPLERVWRWDDEEEPD